MNVFLESLTVILWSLFALSVGLAVWALVRRSAKALLLAALSAGVFAFFFFWDPCGRLSFVWPLVLVAAAAAVKWRRVSWPGWFLVAAGISIFAGSVLVFSHQLKKEAAQPVPGEAVQVAPSDPGEDTRRVIAGYLRAVAAGDAGVLAVIYEISTSKTPEPNNTKDFSQQLCITPPSNNFSGLTLPATSFAQV